jgi:formate dehydrogenase iron-sulfur subunit
MSGPDKIPANQARGLLIDITRCGGCRACVKACRDSHGFAGDPEKVTDMSATDFTALKTLPGDVNVRNMCRHCVEPTCVSVCPVGALQKTEIGAVAYDEAKCLGCRYCLLACPFNVPRYEWDSPVPKVQKCDMCVARQREGKVPACAEACPNEATTAGTRAELIAEAHKRIQEDPSGYHDHVYGEHEVGGTCVLFLAPKSMAAELGYQEILGSAPLPKLTWSVLEKVPTTAVGVGAALWGIWWITRRRDEVAWAQSREKARAKAAKAARRGGTTLGGKEASHDAV